MLFYNVVLLEPTNQVLNLKIIIFCVHLYELI